MKRTHRPTTVVAILALALVLVGCNSPTVVVAPTQDIPTIRTESAATVIAKITIEAALNPSATPASAQPTQTSAAVETATTEPTATPGQATPTPLATFTPFPTLSSSGSGSSASTGGTGVIYPTATLRSGPDQAQFISQTPTDGTVFRPGEQFDGVWTFKNIGTSTWNTNYRINAVTDKGTVMSRQNRYMVREEVKPGETTKIIADMQAPSNAGRYVMYWQLANDNNSVFYGFYMVIDVK